MNKMQGMNPIEHEALPVFAGEKVNSKDGFFEVSHGLRPLNTCMESDTLSVRKDMQQNCARN